MKKTKTNGNKIQLKESIKDILLFIYVLNVFIIMPIEVLSDNIWMYIIVGIKILLGIYLIERTNLFDEV